MLLYIDYFITKLAMAEDRKSTVFRHAGPDFAEYAQKIFAAVKDALDRNELGYAQTLAIFTQLSTMDSKEGLQAKIIELSEKYPALKQIEFKEEVATEEALDELVQKYVSHLIKEGQTKEAEVFAKSAEDKTRAQVETEFPGFKTFNQ